LETSTIFLVINSSLSLTFKIFFDIILLIKIKNMNEVIARLEWYKGNKGFKKLKN
jgi:hypothetical protein